MGFNDDKRDGLDTDSELDPIDEILKRINENKADLSGDPQAEDADEDTVQPDENEEGKYGTWDDSDDFKEAGEEKKGLFAWHESVLKKYATFSGRARREEFWLFCLCNTLIMTIPYALYYFAQLSGSSLLTLIIALPLVVYSLALFIPSIAVTVRRLHDIGKSGGWYFIGVIPFIGVIWLLVLLATPGTIDTNQYGPNPKVKKNGIGDEKSVEAEPFDKSVHCARCGKRCRDTSIAEDCEYCSRCLAIMMETPLKAHGLMLATIMIYIMGVAVVCPLPPAPCSRSRAHR